MSLVETRRVDGRVRHEHVGTLGSIDIAPTVADRVEFWGRLDARLAKLSNRIAGEDEWKIRGAVHDRIPMVTPDEQRALQLEYAKRDARCLETLRDSSAETIDGHKQLIASAERAVTEGEETRERLAAQAAAASERLAQLERGESVAGFNKPMSREELMATLGWKESDLRHAIRLGDIHKLGADDEFVKECARRNRRSEKAASKAVLRRLSRSSPKAG